MDAHDRQHRLSAEARRPVEGRGRPPHGGAGRVVRRQVRPEALSRTSSRAASSRRRRSCARWRPSPEVLFLDEPFSALDFEMTLFIREKLQEVFMQTGTTMMLVSHDLEEAVYLADEVLLLTKRPTRVAEILPLRRPAAAHRRDAVRAELHRAPRSTAWRSSSAKCGAEPRSEDATDAMDRERIEAYVDAAAAALDLPLAPAHRPGVLAYFALAAGLADAVMAAPLGIGDEPAPVFTPIAPDDLPAAALRRDEPGELLAGIAAAIAAAVRDARRQRAAMVEASLAAHRAPSIRRSTPSPTSSPSARARSAPRRRSTRCAAGDARARAAARRRAVRGQEPVRRRRPDDAAPARRSNAERAARHASTRRWSRGCETAGAVLVGALNMDEYAYGFTTENIALRRRRAIRTTSPRVAGGSSGGSGAAVAARPGAAQRSARTPTARSACRRRCAASSA